MSDVPAGGPPIAAPAAARDAAERFARYVAPTFVTLARRAVELAEIEPGDSVLDLGTATGLAAFLAAERTGRDGTVIGLDTSAEMLAVASRRSEAVGYGYIRWQQGEAAPLDFADESFDAVLCIQSLSTLANPYAALEEVRRVLVEGGRVVITTWGTRAGNEWISLIDDALRRAEPHVTRPRGLPFAQPGNLEAVLQAVGFREIEVARVPDRMFLQGLQGFWDWIGAIGRWAEVIAALSPAAQARVRRALETSLATRLHEGELAIAREILFARAIAPEGA